MYVFRLRPCEVVPRDIRSWVGNGTLLVLWLFVLFVLFMLFGGFVLFVLFWGQIADEMDFGRLGGVRWELGMGWNGWEGIGRD